MDLQWSSATPGQRRQLSVVEDARNEVAEVAKLLGSKSPDFCPAMENPPLQSRPTKRHKTLSQTMLWQPKKKDGQWPHKNDSMESHPSKPLSVPSAMKLHEVRLGHYFPELLSGCLKVLQWSNWKVEIRWCLERWGEQPLHWAVVSKFERLQASGWGWHIPKGMCHQNQPFLGVPFCFRHGCKSGFHRQEMITNQVKLLWSGHVSCQERDICFISTLNWTLIHRG